VSEQTSPERMRTNATVRLTRWPGWIWAIPIAAVLVVGWWAGRSLLEGGEDITISFDDVHGMKQENTNVTYRGMSVGRSKSLALAKDGHSVDVSVHLDESVAPFLTTGTRFWLKGANPSLSDLSSLGAVLSGPSIVMEPGPGTKATHFVGLAREPIVPNAHEEPEIYGASLNGSVGRLKQGAPVKLLGFTIGEVKDIGFRYDAESGEIATPVTLALYPSLFPIESAAPAEAKAAFAAGMEKLIREGLQARLERDPPVIGDAQVTLDIVPGATATPPAPVKGVPQIPAATGGGVESVIARINKLPIDQIGQNLLDITQHVNGIVGSPALTDAISQLDSTLKQAHETADKAGPKIAELVTSFRRTAAQLDSAAKAADKVLGGTPSQNSTQQAMREITEAARSVRDLADFLDRHPEALIRGRSGE